MAVKPYCFPVALITLLPHSKPEVLYSALANRNLKELSIEELYVVSDNVKEIKSATEELRKIGIKRVRTTPYSPWENGEIESFLVS